MISKLGLFDTRTSLVITYIVQTLPVSLYMLGNYFRTIPESIEEAAIIDGCSRLEVIYRIVLPLSAPAIVSVFIYAFMIAWNEYLFASVFINSSSLRTLPLGLNQLFYTQHYVWGRMMAASVLTAIPVIILFLSVERFITGGLTFGGVKE
jgi:multiple sugar transport system permease protein